LYVNNFKSASYQCEACTRGRKVGNIDKVWGATKRRMDGGTGWGRMKKVVHGGRIKQHAGEVE
jgi:hypothetical protein